MLFRSSRFVKNHGFQGGSQKNAIIQQCDALLFPVKWEEPFGLAIIEAMSYGLPVIGSPYGSLPELIKEDVGIICSTEKEFIESIRECPRKFEAKNIISYARETFSSLKMTHSYIKFYQKVIDGEKLNKVSPEWKFKNRATSPLSF